MPQWLTDALWQVLGALWWVISWVWHGLYALLGWAYFLWIAAAFVIFPLALAATAGEWMQERWRRRRHKRRRRHRGL
jgi:hypothetical protein